MRAVLLGFLLLLAPAIAARAQPVTIPTPAGMALHATLALPPGPQRAPAIVVMHGCGGVSRRDTQWVDLFTRAGHAVLSPDSYGSRGLGPQCRVRRGERTLSAEADRRADALAAAAWLAARPGTPPGGVVLMGWSDGGSAVLAAASRAPDVPPGLFRGFVAFYPICQPTLARPGWHAAAPLLVLSGEADRRAPIAPCRSLAAQAPGLTLVPFPGAGHNFDARAPAQRTAEAQADAAARDAAIVQVPQFLASLPPR